MFDGMNYMHVKRKKEKGQSIKLNIIIFQKEKCLITFG